MRRYPGRRYSWSMLVGLCAVAGCAPDDVPIPITGAVTFDGQPVGEGVVQFVDEKTGRGAEVRLGADGRYSAELHKGTYNVLVSPPYIEENTGGLPSTKYKKVNNIPNKYHSTATSGLSATVGPDQKVHDFALQRSGPSAPTGPKS
ncbi:carboxypeptidase-like regulatory domain-containing protein [Gemmata sp. JC717]|uniref:carboxypeptidase-like regulatory domain-containing protein n=1 Tax=Gemmata algarum TaxID=2975278 RepID=UPI0021BA6F59|nr:carboxypeptidase-like regulatory domain-containing protein [Gemmata algarum]MDY3554162.1 carboxypeptidase-like regulatory domain-containing protein [Gemmata algarum]